MEIIRVDRLSRIFRTGTVETHALRDVSFQVNRGEFVAVEGPSGGGKSTLLNILGLLDSASSGRYVLSGVDVSNIADGERRRVRNRYIGSIFQAFNLIPTLTVLDNVMLPLYFRSRAQRSDALARAMAVIDRVGMSNRATHYPEQLSGGQQQRVAIARALVGSPEIILADEPTGNLDSTNADNVSAILGDLHAEGQTIVMVTHNPELARKADRRFLLRDGELTSA